MSEKGKHKRPARRHRRLRPWVKKTAAAMAAVMFFAVMHALAPHGNAEKIPEFSHAEDRAVLAIPSSARMAGVVRGMPAMETGPETEQPDAAPGIVPDKEPDAVPEAETAVQETAASPVPEESADHAEPETGYDFEPADFIMYAAGPSALRSAPDQSADMTLLMDPGTEVRVTGTGDSRYWRIETADASGYTAKDNLIDSYEPPAEVAVSAETYSGEVLTPEAGTVQGPSGKETYYNLPMEGIVDIMRGIGNTDEYWVRSDGVRMLGNYVMIAADLSIRPRGSIVPTSLGDGIVCDTGDFIYDNPYQIDIAVSW